jgi:glucan endo-1,3-beta-D-glucosidase
MTHLIIFYLLTQCLTLAATKVYTGFNYGAYWRDDSAKTKEDFVRQFNLAKSLDTPVSFDSARLSTSVQWHTDKTTMDPIEAFDAAIETNTSLLLGIWLPSFDAELIALDKAFTTHGQKLADLVIGISVGNEDVHSGFANSDVVEDKIRALRRMMDKHGSLFKRKKLLVGHTDIAGLLLTLEAWTSSA